MDGVQRQKWLRGFKSKTLAKAGYLAFVEEYCTFTRVNPARRKNAAKETLLVGDLVRQYLTTLGNQNKQSVIYDKENIYRNFVLNKYDKTPIDKLTKEELLFWQDELWSSKNKRTGNYFSHKYLSKVRGFFNTFLSWVEERYNYKNYLKEIKMPPRRQPKTVMKFWTQEQFKRFIAVVDNDTYKALFSFLFYTGRRKGEIFALYKTDVKADKVTFNKSVNRRTFRTGTWEVTSTKEEKTCTVPVCKPVQEIIKWYKPPKDGKFYFGGEEPLAATTVDRYFKKYTELAGLPEIRIHDLRHSFVSMLLHLGANFMVVADLISDTVEQVTKTYGHLYEEDKLSILARI
jgi:integrase